MLQSRKALVCNEHVCLVVGSRVFFLSEFHDFLKILLQSSLELGQTNGLVVVGIGRGKQLFELFGADIFAIVKLLLEFGKNLDCLADRE